MRDLPALKGLLFMLLLFAAAMAATGTAVSLGMDRYLVPTPENSAEQFVRALKAHRFQAARDLLSEGLAEEVDEKQLRELVEALEASRGGIHDAHGRESHESGEEATASVEVVLSGGEENTLEFPLEKEEGIWRITSIEAMARLSSG